MFICTISVVVSFQTLSREGSGNETTLEFGLRILKCVVMLRELSNASRVYFHDTSLRVLH